MDLLCMFTVFKNPNVILKGAASYYPQTTVIEHVFVRQDPLYILWIYDKLLWMMRGI
jgi:hypothetical protein